MEMQNITNNTSFKSIMQDFLGLPVQDSPFCLLTPFEETAANIDIILDDIDEIVSSGFEFEESLFDDGRVEYLDDAIQCPIRNVLPENSEHYLLVPPAFILAPAQAPAPAITITTPSAPSRAPARKSELARVRAPAIPSELQSALQSAIPPTLKPGLAPALPLALTPEPVLVPGLAPALAAALAPVAVPPLFPDLKLWEVVVLYSESNDPSANMKFPEWLVADDSQKHTQDRFVAVQAVDRVFGRYQLLCKHVAKHVESTKNDEGSDSDGVIYVEVTNDPMKEDDIAVAMLKNGNSQQASVASSPSNASTASEMDASGSKFSDRKVFDKLSSKNINIPVLNPIIGSKIGEKSRRKQQLPSYTSTTVPGLEYFSRSPTQSKRARDSSPENFQVVTSATCTKADEGSKENPRSRRCLPTKAARKSMPDGVIKETHATKSFVVSTSMRR